MFVALVLAAVVAACFVDRQGFWVSIVNNYGEPVLLHVWGRESATSLADRMSYRVPPDGVMYDADHALIVRTSTKGPIDGRVAITTESCDVIFDLVVTIDSYVLTPQADGQVDVISGRDAVQANLDTSGGLLLVPIDSPCDLR